MFATEQYFTVFGTNKVATRIKNVYNINMFMINDVFKVGEILL